MVMLAYDLAGGQDLEEIIPFAMSNEFIHTASLVHDDINDEALTRRGKDTIHAKYGQSKPLLPEIGYSHRDSALVVNTKNPWWM